MDILIFFQQIQNPILDFIFENFTHLVNEIVMVGIISVIYWCYSKKTAQLIAFSLFASGIVVQITKIICRVPRPWILDNRIQPKPEILETATGYSFPSGHTQNSTAFCNSSASTIKHKGIKVVILLIPIFVMISRMYVGVHTPQDVLTSYVIATIITWIVIKVFEKYSIKRIQTLSMVIFTSSILGLIYSCCVVNAGVSTFELVDDAAKICGCGIGFSIGVYLETKYINFKEVTSTRNKLVVVVLGIIGTLILKLSTGLLPDNVIFVALSYMLITFWISYAYPLIFTKFLKK